MAITRRLWSIAKDVEGATSTSSLRFVSRVMAESGVLYLLITTAHFIVWFTPSSVAISVVSTIVRNVRTCDTDVYSFLLIEHSCYRNWLQSNHHSHSSGEGQADTLYQILRQTGCLFTSLCYLSRPYETNGNGNPHWRYWCVYRQHVSN